MNSCSPLGPKLDAKSMTWLWASRADWDAHMVSAHVRHMGSVQNEFLREPTPLRFYVPK